MSKLIEYPRRTYLHCSTLDISRTAKPLYRPVLPLRLLLLMIVAVAALCTLRSVLRGVLSYTFCIWNERDIWHRRSKERKRANKRGAGSSKNKLVVLYSNCAVVNQRGDLFFTDLFMIAIIISIHTKLLN